MNSGEFQKKRTASFKYGIKNGVSCWKLSKKAKANINVVNIVLRD